MVGEVANTKYGRAIKRMDRLSQRNDPKKNNRGEPFGNDEWMDRLESGTENPDASRKVNKNVEMAFIVRTNVKYGQTSFSVRLCGSVDVKIDWGDGIVDRVTELSEIVSHAYGEDGEHTVYLFDGRLEEFAVGPDCWGGCVVQSARRRTNANVQVPGYSAWHAPWMGLTPRKTSLKRGIFLMRGCEMDPALPYWDTSRVLDMSFLFAQSKLFERDQSNWNAENVENMDSMFYGMKKSTPKYDALLIEWASQNVCFGVELDPRAS